MAGISDKALKTQYAQNKYRYNGKEMQNQEFSDGSGLEEYDYGARYYDQQIGRWGNIDPHAPNYNMFSPYIYVGNNPLLLVDPNGEDWFFHSSDGKSDPMWQWHEGSEYHTGVKDENGDEVVLQGTEAVVVFDGSKAEKLDENGKLNTAGAVTADVTVYGPDGKDDIHHYSGYTMSSNPESYGVVADGIYDGNYREKGKTGALESHWAVNDAGEVPDMRGLDPYTNLPYLTGVYIHRSNNSGFAGETLDKNGKKVAISKGCLLIDPLNWADFNKVMNGVQNFKVQVDRAKKPIEAVRGSLNKEYLDKAYSNYLTGN